MIPAKCCRDERRKGCFFVSSTSVVAVADPRGEAWGARSPAYLRVLMTAAPPPPPPLSEGLEPSLCGFVATVVRDRK